MSDRTWTPRRRQLRLRGRGRGAIQTTLQFQPAPPKPAPKPAPVIVVIDQPPAPQQQQQAEDEQENQGATVPSVAMIDMRNLDQNDDEDFVLSSLPSTAAASSSAVSASTSTSSSTATRTTRRRAKRKSKKDRAALERAREAEAKRQRRDRKRRGNRVSNLAEALRGREAPAEDAAIALTAQLTIAPMDPQQAAAHEVRIVASELGPRPRVPPIRRVMEILEGEKGDTPSQELRLTPESQRGMDYDQRIAHKAARMFAGSPQRRQQQQQQRPRDTLDNVLRLQSQGQQQQSQPLDSQAIDQFLATYQSQHSSPEWQQPGYDPLVRAPGYRDAQHTALVEYMRLAETELRLVTRWGEEDQAPAPRGYGNQDEMVTWEKEEQELRELEEQWPDSQRQLAAIWAGVRETAAREGISHEAAQRRFYELADWYHLDEYVKSVNKILDRRFAILEDRHARRTAAILADRALFGAARAREQAAVAQQEAQISLIDAQTRAQREAERQVTAMQEHQQHQQQEEEITFPPTSLLQLNASLPQPLAPTTSYVALHPVEERELIEAHILQPRVNQTVLEQEQALREWQPPARRVVTAPLASLSDLLPSSQRQHLEAAQGRQPPVPANIDDPAYWQAVSSGRPRPDLAPETSSSASATQLDLTRLRRNPVYDAEDIALMQENARWVRLRNQAVAMEWQIGSPGPEAPLTVVPEGPSPRDWELANARSQVRRRAAWKHWKATHPNASRQHYSRAERYIYMGVHPPQDLNEANPGIWERYAMLPEENHLRARRPLVERQEVALARAYAPGGTGIVLVHPGPAEDDQGSSEESGPSGFRLFPRQNDTVVSTYQSGASQRGSTSSRVSVAVDASASSGEENAEEEEQVEESQGSVRERVLRLAGMDVDQPGAEIAGHEDEELTPLENSQAFAGWATQHDSQSSSQIVIPVGSDTHGAQQMVLAPETPQDQDDPQGLIIDEEYEERQRQEEILVVESQPQAQQQQQEQAQARLESESATQLPEAYRADTQVDVAELYRLVTETPQEEVEEVVSSSTSPSSSHSGRTRHRPYTQRAAAAAVAPHSRTLPEVIVIEDSQSQASGRERPSLPRLVAGPSLAPANAAGFEPHRPGRLQLRGRQQRVAAASSGGASISTSSSATIGAGGWLSTSALRASMPPAARSARRRRRRKRQTTRGMDVSDSEEESEG
jgi:hypothetical protein